MARTVRQWLAGVVLFAVAPGLGLGLAVIAQAAVQPPFVAAPIRDRIPEPTQYVNARVLAANTAETVTVPDASAIAALAQEPGTRIVVAFSASCSSYYVRYGGTAAVPSADVTDGSAAVRNPPQLIFAQGETFSIIAPDACIVTMSLGQSRY